MKAFEFTAEVDERRHIELALPHSVPPGTVRIIVLTPDAEEDETRDHWMHGIAREWAEELADTREDIYTLEEGEAIDAAR